MKMQQDKTALTGWIALRKRRKRKTVGAGLITGISHNRGGNSKNPRQQNNMVIEELQNSQTGNKIYSIIPSFHHSKFFIYFFLLILFASCDKARVYEKNVKIPKFEWEVDNVLKFE